MTEPATGSRNGRWIVLAALSFAFFFVTGTTFTSLAVVLFTMAAELHWSASDAGLSFSLLGLACGVSSPLPAIAIRRLGVRATVAGGAGLLAAGFALAGLSHGIATFFVAICLMGCAFSLLAPVPGMFLLPRWFGLHAPRMIGFYFMGGSAGGVLGPLLVDASVAWTGSWRLHWALMAAASLLLCLVSVLFVRDRSEAAVQADAAHGDGLPPSGWTAGSAMLTRPFLVIAFIMLVVQTGLTVSNSALVPHLARLGGTQNEGAVAMGLLALAGTLAKGATGTLAERVHPLPILGFGLLVGALAFLLLGFGHAIGLAFVAAALIGIAWGAAWLGAHLFLLRCFGREATPELVAFATTVTTLAVVGPFAAGIVADRTGHYGPVFLVVAGLFGVALLASILLLRAAAAPARHGALPAAR